MKTNTGLVKYAEAQLGRPYWYGTFGNKATQDLLERKTAQYPQHYQQARMEKYVSQLGMRVHDCVGLIKGYLWSDDVNSTPEYNSAQDVSANGMLKMCKQRGRMHTMPEIPGILVFMPGHVGIYCGAGRVIEARGFHYGVVETKLSERNWENWGKCPWIKYPIATRYFGACAKDETSIVDALKSLGENSGYAYRKRIAASNGIADYSGTAKENIRLLSLLRQGKLIRPDSIAA
ncbi:MAG: DUF3597 domain-containing protein [Ruminococcaceae bacterium]|nr:DUF3597 domain-containing protein [Oscillospiraceae bacterium]